MNGACNSLPSRVPASRAGFNSFGNDALNLRISIKWHLFAVAVMRGPTAVFGGEFQSESIISHHHRFVILLGAPFHASQADFSLISFIIGPMIDGGVSSIATPPAPKPVKLIFVGGGKSSDGARVRFITSRHSFVTRSDAMDPSWLSTLSATRRS